jgi:hypothetical protein
MHVVNAARIYAMGTASVAIATTACVGFGEKPGPAPTAGDKIVWDYSEAPQSPSLSLWPPSSSVPERIKRNLRTHQEDDTLQVEVSGLDPGFVWQFSKPVNAGALRVELGSREGTSLQLFWAGTHCPSFKEECSAKVSVARGRQTIALLLPEEPLTELRLDFAEEKGHRVDIFRLDVLGERHVQTAWTAAPSTTTAIDSDGLAIVAGSNDPWVTAEIPQLKADSVDAVEVFCDAPKGTVSQLFWHGSECTHFEERCSVLFPPTESAAPTGTWVDLGAVPTWNGRIDGLRFDPGSAPARYVVERIALLRTTNRIR